MQRHRNSAIQASPEIFVRPGPAATFCVPSIKMTEAGCERLVESFRSVLSQVEPHAPDCLEASIPTMPAVRPEPRFVETRDSPFYDKKPPSSKSSFLWVWIAVSILITTLLATIVFLLCRKPKERPRVYKRTPSTPRREVEDSDEEEDEYDEEPPSLRTAPPLTATKVAARRIGTTRSDQALHPQQMRGDTDRDEREEEDPMFQPLRQK